MHLVTAGLRWRAVFSFLAVYYLYSMRFLLG